MELGDSMGLEGEDEASMLGGVVTILAPRRNVRVENGIYEKRADPCCRP